MKKFLCECLKNLKLIDRIIIIFFLVWAMALITVKLFIEKNIFTSKMSAAVEQVYQLWKDGAFTPAK
jgi:hypothetical protein